MQSFTTNADVLDFIMDFEGDLVVRGNTIFDKDNNVITNFITQ